MTKEKLNEILGLHTKWLRDEPGGVRANLSDANLSYADLSGAEGLIDAIDYIETLLTT